MMRNKLILILLLLPIVATAQIKFGHISYAEICQQMPQYKEAQKQLAELKTKYEKEATRNEEEFQRKFADFLQGQKDFPSNILQKRQAELQDLMERSIAFRQEAQALLDKAERDMVKGLYSQLNDIIRAISLEQHYAFVLNTDNNAVPFIDTEMGDDITDLVRLRLGLIDALPAGSKFLRKPEVIEPDNLPLESEGQIDSEGQIGAEGQIGSEGQVVSEGQIDSEGQVGSEGQNGSEGQVKQADGGNTVKENAPIEVNNTTESAE